MKCAAVAAHLYELNVWLSMDTCITTALITVFVWIILLRKTSRHWPLWGNSPVTGEFPAQMASNAENVSIWWRHHKCTIPMPLPVRTVFSSLVYIFSISLKLMDANIFVTRVSIFGLTNRTYVVLKWNFIILNSLNKGVSPTTKDLQTSFQVNKMELL